MAGQTIPGEWTWGKGVFHCVPGQRRYTVTYSAWCKAQTLFQAGSIWLTRSQAWIRMSLRCFLSSCSTTSVIGMALWLKQVGMIVPKGDGNVMMCCQKGCCQGWNILQCRSAYFLLPLCPNLKCIMRELIQSNVNEQLGVLSSEVYTDCKFYILLIAVLQLVDRGLKSQTEADHTKVGQSKKLW